MRVGGQIRRPAKVGNSEPPGQSLNSSRPHPGKSYRKVESNDKRWSSVDRQENGRTREDSEGDPGPYKALGIGPGPATNTVVMGKSRLASQSENW
jgi:hypothetical protein